MKTKMILKNAISAINQNGILLVFPIGNRKVPPSLWSTFFPRSEMRWEWDEEGDSRVGDLWRLRQELSCSGEVVYSKWYQERATFFSKEVFMSFMTLRGTAEISLEKLSEEAQEMLEILNLDSPLSTKVLKKTAGLQGKYNEGRYKRALKELWSNFLIVGYGEVDDGAFPSLAIGSTKNLFEDLFQKSKTQTKNVAHKVLERNSKLDSTFLKYFSKQDEDV